MRSSRFFLAAALLPLLQAHEGQAATLHVPSEYGTIQAGLDAATFGDTVLVAPGTYTDFEVRFPDGFARTACAFLADGVVLRSEQGSGATTIDMQGMGTAQPDVVIARALPSDETVLEGFTVTGAPIGGSGAHVALSGKVTFRDCLFRDLDVGSILAGAGINAGSNDIDVIGCEFVNCRSTGSAAIYNSDSQIRIIGSRFRECGSTAVGLLGNPGGRVDAALIENCEFIDDFTSSGGGGAIASGYVGEVVIRGCLFEGNESSGTGGGAIQIGGFGPKMIENCLFLFNSATGIDGEGGAIKVVTFCTIRGNTFYGNSQASTFSGGAAIASFVGGFALENNIIAASTGGEAIFAGNVPVSSSCNVFWDNPEGNGDGYTLGPTDREVDPLFCDPEMADFTLMDGSPCLPENSLGCGLIGALPQGCGMVAVEERSWGSIKGSYRWKPGRDDP